LLEAVVERETENRALLETGDLAWYSTYQLMFVGTSILQDVYARRCTHTRKYGCKEEGDNPTNFTIKTSLKFQYEKILKDASSPTIQYTTLHASRV
jgi:hypothetical protein